MLDIRIQNKSLDLGKVSVTFQLTSPIFNEVGSFSYPFTLPNTSKNKMLLGFLHRVNNSTYPVAAMADIFVNGLFWKNGELYVTESNKDYIKVHFTLGEGYFYNRINVLGLKDLDLGGSRNVADYSGAGVNDVFSLAYNSNYPDCDFTLFEINNRNFYKDTDYHEIHNNYDNLAVNKYDKDLLMNVENNTFIPFVYLNYVIKKIFSQLNISINYNFIDFDSEFMQMVIYNNVGVNTFIDDAGTISIRQNESFDLLNHVPDISVSEFFKVLQNTFGIYIISNEYTNSVNIIRLKDILLNNSIRVFDKDYSISKIKQNTYDGLSLTWKFDSTDSYHKGGLHGIEPKSIDISRYNFLGNRVNGVGLIGTGNLGDCYFLENKFLYAVKEYHFSIAYGNEWVLAWDTSKSNAFCDFKIGKGGLKITPQATLFRCYNSFLSALQKGNITDLPGDFNSFDLRFLLYRGMVEQTVGGDTFDKPYGSSASRFNGYEWEYSLYWHGSAGLYEMFWKEIIEFHQNTHEASFQMLLNPSDFKRIDFSRKYRFANANWLFSKIKFTVSEKGISPARIEAFKV